MSLPTLADLKAHLDKTTNTDDVELSEMLEAAVDVVEGIVGPVTAKTVTETHTSSSGVLVLNRVPVAGLVSVAQYGAAQDLALFHADPDSGILSRVDGYGFAGPVTVTYSVGRPNVPAAIRLAVLIIAAHLWETQRGNTGGGPIAAEAEAFGAPSIAGYAIPNRARDLLARYVPTTLA